MRRVGAVEARQNRRRPTPVENAAAHRHEIHHGVGEPRVARRDVAPQIAIVPAKRLGAAADDDVDALIEQRAP